MNPYLHPENKEFPDTTEISYGQFPQPSNDSPSFIDMKKQLCKRKINKKPKEDRILEISLLLADRLCRKSYK